MIMWSFIAFKIHEVSPILRIEVFINESSKKEMIKKYKEIINKK